MLRTRFTTMSRSRIRLRRKSTRDAAISLKPAQRNPLARNTALALRAAELQLLTWCHGQPPVAFIPL